MPNILRQIKKAEPRGQGLVEFALILPLLLLLVLGVIEFGRLLFIYTEISNAAREAVRYGVARGVDSSFDGPNYLDCEGIMQAARSTTVITGLADGDFEIGYDRGGGLIFPWCDSADDPENPPDVRFGDRLVITVTHTVEPLVLLRDTGSLQVMFTTARTIVEQGIALPGETPPEDEDGEGPIGDWPEVTFVVEDPFACRGYLEWTSVSYADSYMVYRTLPTPTTEITSGIVGLRYPITGTLQAEEGEEYAIRGFNEFGRGPLFGRDTVAGCNYPAYPDLLELEFKIVETDPCTGYFGWQQAPKADGYRLYGHDGTLVAEVAAPPYPLTTTLPVVNGQVYVVTAFNENGEGLHTPTTVAGCTLPPPDPTGLTYYLDQSTPPCLGHLRWNSVLGADDYYIYRNGAYLDKISITRYPAYPTNHPIASGEVYTVTAVNITGGESGPSNAVAVPDADCYLNQGEVDVTYYLHSKTSPPIWHRDEPPFFYMDERFPGHSILYNYNSSDLSKPGREVVKGGSTPGGNPVPLEKFLEWRTGEQDVPLTLRGNVSVTLWGKNPANQTVVAKAYLYELDGSGYSLIAQTSYTWQPSVTDWQTMPLTFAGTTGRVIDKGGELVLWVISDNAKSLHFAYDTIPYNSQIQFTGRWDQ